MTKEEIAKKGQEKVKLISGLCEKLQVTLSAEEMITTDGFIRRVVYFNDTEKYDVEEPIVEPTEVKADE